MAPTNSSHVNRKKIFQRLAAPLLRQRRHGELFQHCTLSPARFTRRARAGPAAAGCWLYGLRSPQIRRRQRIWRTARGRGRRYLVQSCKASPLPDQSLGKALDSTADKKSRYDAKYTSQHHGAEPAPRTPRVVGCRAVCQRTTPSLSDRGIFTKPPRHGPPAHDPVSGAPPHVVAHNNHFPNHRKTVGLVIHFHGHMGAAVQVRMGNALVANGKSPASLPAVLHIEGHGQSRLPADRRWRTERTALT